MYVIEKIVVVFLLFFVYNKYNIYRLINQVIYEYFWKELMYMTSMPRTLYLIFVSSISLFCAVVSIFILSLATSSASNLSAIQEQELIEKQEFYLARYEEALKKRNEMLAVVIPDDMDTNILDSNTVMTDIDGVSVYIIQPGDTLSSLSAMFGYSVDELANFNQIRDVHLIYSNSALRIPTED